MDSLQAIASTLTTEAFGNAVAQWGSSANPYRFAGAWGYRDDGDAGLLHVGARYYDPQVGRFISRDAVLSEHPYLYCEHEPVNAVDPSGDDRFDDLTKFFVRVPVVQVVGTEQEPAHRDDLRRSLLRFLSQLGDDETVCEQLSLSDLPSRMYRAARGHRTNGFCAE